MTVAQLLSLTDEMPARWFSGGSTQYGTRTLFGICILNPLISLQLTTFDLTWPVLEPLILILAAPLLQLYIKEVKHNLNCYGSTKVRDLVGGHGMAKPQIHPVNASHNWSENWSIQGKHKK